MSITQTPREKRFLLYDIGWQGYQQLLDILGDRPIRVTYDRGNIELMSPSHAPESYGYLLARFVETLTEELNLPIKGGGSTTFNREDVDRGLEPDECYYIQNEPRVRGKKKIDLTRDPPPDLALEVDITSSSLDRMGIYAALKVPELWRLDGQTLRVYILQPDGQYALSDRSAAFPFLPLAEIVRFLQLSDTMDETSLVRSFRAWVRDQIAAGWPGTSAASG
jgi:Uma2 family endonuclease